MNARPSRPTALIRSDFGLAPTAANVGTAALWTCNGRYWPILALRFLSLFRGQNLNLETMSAIQALEAFEFSHIQSPRGR